VIAGQKEEEKITVSKSSGEEEKQHAVRTINVRLKYPIYVQKKDRGWGGMEGFEMQHSVYLDEESWRGCSAEIAS
jgi:hypothetical protein